MIIKTLTVGPLQVNNYLVIDEESQKAVLIDAGGDYELTKKTLDGFGVKLEYILNTHGHFDHIAGDSELQQKEGVKVFVHKDDENLFYSLKQQLAMFAMPEFEEPKIDGFVEEGKDIDLGNLKFQVLHTPGHSLGSVCYLIDDVVFAGDTLFQKSVGRTDLPGGSYEQLKDSVVNKLYMLDDSVTVYPGHGPSTTIGSEKQCNPFFKA